jgi:hypothetical protein
MEFVATPVSVTDAAKDFYVPDQAPLSVVLCCLDEHGPIVA